MKANLLVVDSGPLIKSLPELANISQNLITVPEVIAEIKDESSRKAIEGLELQVRTPSEKCMKQGN
jgi:rRNA maturation endonuclease Nob1